MYYLLRGHTLENIQDKIIKELEKKNINNKNYFWILSIIVLTTIIIIYSYQTDSGIIAKQTINKELVIKNQENLKQLYTENKIQESLPKNEVLAVQDSNTTVLIEEPQVNDEESAQEEAMAQEEEMLQEQMQSQEEILAQTKEDETPIVATKNIEEKITLTETTVKSPIKEVAVKVEEKIVPQETKAVAVLPVVEKQTNTLSQNENVEVVIEPKTNFNIMHCYGFETAKSSFSSSCEENLNEFIQKNSNATQLEIIGLIDIEDVAAMSNKGEINQGLLAKNRIIAVKEFLENKTNIPLSQHFFYLKSELQTKGFVLRAYF